MQLFAKQVSTFNAIHSIHKKRVMDELRNVGVSRLGLARFDAQYLPVVIHPTEHIMGVVYGYDAGESVFLVATDQRVFYLNKKPFYVNQDDISYDVISGVSFNHVGPVSSITLHTHIKDYKIHTFNRKSAGRFVHFMEFNLNRLNVQNLSI